MMFSEEKIVRRLVKNIVERDLFIMKKRIDRWVRKIFS